MSPKISVIMPSYNQAEYIEEAICSILNQDYSNIELIIIDGGSTDNTVDIIKKYKERIYFWSSQKDNGQTDAINTGFRLATGDLVAWMNSDDFYLKDAFKKVASYYSDLDETPDAIFGDIALVDDKSNLIRVNKYPRNRLLHFEQEGCMMTNQATFWKRSLFNQIGFLDESYQFAMDYEFFYRLTYKKFKIHHIPQLIGAFRYQEESKSMSDDWMKIHDSDLDRIFKTYNAKRSNLKKLISISFRFMDLLSYFEIRYILSSIIKKINNYTIISKIE
jgi:glycosyltransferase involved in cell wall biosynthesis